MKQKLIALRKKLNANYGKTDLLFDYDEHKEARSFVNNCAFPNMLDEKLIKSEYEFHVLLKNNIKLAHLQRLIFIDFLIVSDAWEIK